MTDRVQWREEPDGFRYLVTDYRGSTTQERFEVFRERTAAVPEGVDRIPVLVLAADEGLDPMWFKEVKDHNSSTARDDRVRVALVGTGRKGGALAAMLNARLPYERARSFADEAEAVAWLREADPAGLTPGR